MKLKVPRYRIPSAPLVAAFFRCNILCCGALMLSVLIILPHNSGVYSQIIADYQAECEINPLTASH